MGNKDKLPELAVGIGSSDICLFLPFARVDIEEEGQQRRSSTGSCGFTPDDNRYLSHPGVAGWLSLVSEHPDLTSSQITVFV